MAVRIAVLGLVAVVLFCGLFFRLWALQVISGDRYLEDANNNQVRTFRVPAARGTIVASDGTVLAANRPGTQIQLWPAAFDDMPRARIRSEFRRLAPLLNVKVQDLRKALAQGKTDPLSPVTLKTAVRNFKVNYLLEREREFPGIQINAIQLRKYRYGADAAQLLGYTGQISAGQLKAREDDGYAAGDIIGQSGVEASYDRYLRGRAGGRSASTRSAASRAARSSASCRSPGTR